MELRSAEYWDERYKENRIGWDLGMPSKPLTTFLDSYSDKDTRILLPAGGNNYDAEYAHRKGFSNLHVIDVSENALSAFIKRYPHFPKANIHHGDFFEHTGRYDLILEQTFFCAINYDLRSAYARKMFELLEQGGILAGLWFDFPFTNAEANPPLGGSIEEYLEYFEPYFEIKTFERCYNSANQDRQGKELFGIMKKK